MIILQFVALRLLTIKIKMTIDIIDTLRGSSLKTQLLPFILDRVDRAEINIWLNSVSRGVKEVIETVETHINPYSRSSLTKSLLDYNIISTVELKGFDTSTLLTILQLYSVIFPEKFCAYLDINLEEFLSDITTCLDQFFEEPIIVERVSEFFAQENDFIVFPELKLANKFIISNRIYSTTLLERNPLLQKYYNIDVLSILCKTSFFPSYFSAGVELDALLQISLNRLNQVISKSVIHPAFAWNLHYNPALYSTYGYPDYKPYTFIITKLTKEHATVLRDLILTGYRFDSLAGNTHLLLILIIAYLELSPEDEMAPYYEQAIKNRIRSNHSLIMNAFIRPAAEYQKSFSVEFLLSTFTHRSSGAAPHGTIADFTKLGTRIHRFKASPSQNTSLSSISSMVGAFEYIYNYDLLIASKSLFEDFSKWLSKGYSDHCYSDVQVQAIINMFLYIPYLHIAPNRAGVPNGLMDDFIVLLKQQRTSFKNCPYSSHIYNSAMHSYQLIKLVRNNPKLYMEAEVLTSPWTESTDKFWKLVNNHYKLDGFQRLCLLNIIDEQYLYSIY